MFKSATKDVRDSASVWHGQEKQETGNARQGNGIRLADFMRNNTTQIVSEWEAFARTLTPTSNNMTPLALRDHVNAILAFIVNDIESHQTALEQIEKSHGDKEQSTATSAAEIHASLRLSDGFNINQMVSEYRALRASVIKLWSRANTQMNGVDIIDLTRFNESIDQVSAESVNHYTKKVEYAKDLFIGILSHDLRNPLNAISMSAQLQLRMGENERQTRLATQIFDSTSRVTTIINDLLDVTRARFGSGLPVILAPMDMGFISQQLVDEMRAAYPTRTISLEISGDVKGEWDKSRIGQVLSNLIGNAIQYSFKDSSIGVTVKGATDEVLLSVHNEGLPIPSEQIGTIFSSLTRAAADDGGDPAAFNLGLGLYIAKEIVVSHGGTIDVTSSEEDGTTFTARFPRAVEVASNNQPNRTA